ncbi:hypothetical protein CAPTEDRAFT_198289 [Capitella teleta]|uniref:C2H2-type domain-containing protein n=1 Tax=Capitella teleta TaxID=283909 RepID=R7V7A7_CAPTE|nr:hypothetical protein CAPTEDRAFT_198289 [Capitella teleta]|eukprot:ELU11645.1 hypothetical protein CAPTEDRAFT_198289 [Capitella teleta]
MDGCANSVGLVQCLYCLEIFGSVATLEQHKQKMHKDRVEEMNIKHEIKEESDGSAAIEYSPVCKKEDSDEDNEIGIKAEQREEISSANYEGKAESQSDDEVHWTFASLPSKPLPAG